MRLSEIGYKEIIDIKTGTRYGQLWNSEILFEKKTGKINSILIADSQSRFGYRSPQDYLKLPWTSIIKVGDEVIIFEA